MKTQRLFFVALLVVAIASCKKKPQSNCYTCVNHMVWQVFGVTDPMHVYDSSQQCGLDSAGALQYEQLHSKGWYSKDTIFQATVKCHL